MKSADQNTPNGDKNYRAGFVALVGEPNAGKSTLLNAILSEHVSIVSDKPQTTRSRVTGIAQLPNAQIIFVDAPGTLKSTSGINRYLQDEVSDVLEKADVVCALLSADTSEATAKELIARIRASRKPWLAFITKNDTLAGTRTPPYFQYLIEEKIPFVSISSLRRPEEAKEEVLSRILPLLPASPGPLYDPELYTTQTLRQMAAEFVREACFANLKQEIPYGLAVRILEFNENGAVVRVAAQIMVERDNHKGIVIGKGGQMLKIIGRQAREALEKIIGNQVFLQLHVQVQENWTRNPRIMKELGYVVPKN